MLQKTLRVLMVSVVAIAICAAFGCYFLVSGHGFPLDIADGATLLAQIFGLTGLIWIIIHCGTATGTVSTEKLIGSTLVLSLAFGANNTWTYGLSIFIVATLVTELQFLEKLAAMFTDRDKYWEYLTQSSEDVRKKAIIEAVEDATIEEEERSGKSEDRLNAAAPPADVHVRNDKATNVESDDASVGTAQPVDLFEFGPGPGLQNVDSTSSASSEKRTPQDDSRILERDLNLESHGVGSGIIRLQGKADDLDPSARAERNLNFTDRAIDALIASDISFSKGATLRNMKITSRGSLFEADAVISCKTVDYLIEVKNSLSIGVLDRAITNLYNSILGYTNMLRGRGGNKPVQGVLIIPFGVRYKSAIRTITVYEYDSVTDTIRARK